MALHVVTVSNVKSFPRTVTGGIKKRIVTVTFDGTGDYQAGGPSLTAADLGFTALYYVCGLDLTQQGTVGFVPCYDHTNSKLLVYYSDSNGADGPKIEVANGVTTLRNKTMRFFVIGY